MQLRANISTKETEEINKLKNQIQILVNKENEYEKKLQEKDNKFNFLSSEKNKLKQKYDLNLNELNNIKKQLEEFKKGKNNINKNENSKEEMEKLSKKVDTILPLGASTTVDNTGKLLVQRYGKEILKFIRK